MEIRHRTKLLYYDDKGVMCQETDFNEKRRYICGKFGDKFAPLFITNDGNILKASAFDIVVGTGELLVYDFTKFDDYTPIVVPLMELKKYQKKLNSVRFIMEDDK